MGCTQTKDTNVANNVHGGMKPNPLTEKEIQARIEAPLSTKVLELGGVKYRYAYVSQRGYYPESPDKDNQDSFAVYPTFGNPADQQAFFAVYDGHGKDGHYCARFASENLGRTILDKFSRVPQGGLNPKSIKQALSVAHNTTNDQMHADKRFDDSLSGTTAISILLRGRMMYISNVGDSRAIVISTADDGRLVALPLSSDQTPYRKDERERIKKYGSRILSMDQIEGIEPIHENWGDLNLGEDIDEGGDPPRVWSQHGNYPGTAFTRSLGDMIAEDCGVIPEPEILERNVLPNDKFIAIASDGVFEFLTNQMVADIIARYTDPLDACKAVVQTAYEMWLQYEVRTDDITIIILYVDDVKPSNFDNSSSFFSSPENSKKITLSAKDSSNMIGEPIGTSNVAASSTKPSKHLSSSTSNHQLSLDLLEARPVRRVMSREKRKNMIQLKDDDKEDEHETPLTDADIAALVTVKSETDEKTILSAMKSNFLFQHLNAAQRHTVVGLMRPVQVKAGEWVIRQGDSGDKFYVVDSGRFEVRVKSWAFPTENDVHLDMDDEERERVGGNVVHVYESGAEQHPGFGELSLMYGKPRAASVIALEDGLLWALDRRIFKRVVLRPRDMRREVIRILKKVELFKCLNVTQLQRLTDLLNEKSFSSGEYIIRQGEEGTSFYIIVSGNCDCSINQPDAAPKIVMQLKDYDYFGERALLESKPRAANVVATKDTKCLYIEKQAFEEVLGPLAQIIEADRERREALAAEALAAPQRFEDLHFNGVIIHDSLGPLLLGTFGTSTGTPLSTVRSIMFSDVQKSASGDSVLRFVEIAKLLRQSQLSTMLPHCSSILRQSNGLHLVFSTPIVADLSYFIRTFASKLSLTPSTPTPSTPSSPAALPGSTSSNNLVSATVGASHSISPFLLHAFATICCAIEALHDLNIVYRAIQPESIYVDARGQLILMDYRFCKLGLVQGSGSKAFTICGASDYLSPEQIAQTGHSFPVDFWGMGVLLYELAVGAHPFSSNTEVATYSKITSFGSKTFPALKFPDNINAEVKALINQLLVPTPEARIGSIAMKKHPFFESFTSWDILGTDAYQSPIASLAQRELEEIQKEGMDQSTLDLLSANFEEPAAWLKSLDA